MDHRRHPRESTLLAATPTVTWSRRRPSSAARLRSMIVEEYDGRTRGASRWGAPPVGSREPHLGLVRVRAARKDLIYLKSL